MELQPMCVYLRNLEALTYLKNKNLQPAFSYKDVWHEEHATAFTVAKAMQLDVLADLHTAVVGAMEKGRSFESFKKNLKLLLQQKSWWGKKDYFQDKLNAGGLSEADKAKFEQFLKDLDEFTAEGKHYYEVQTALKKAQDTLTNLKKGGMVKSGLDDAFSEARENAALRVKSPKEADEALREVRDKVWQNATKAECRAISDYTCGSGGFNRSLRGYNGSWSSFKGIGKVDLDAEGRASAIKKMTRLIDKSSCDIDIWLQRGVETSQGAVNFLQVAEKDLWNLTQNQLEQKLLNKDITDTAFVSCGSARREGFSGYIFNSYCTKGTKMMYAEPFSSYGYVMCNGGKTVKFRL